HEFTPEEAREAGRKGGEASHPGQALRTGGNQPGTGRGSGTHFAGTPGGAAKPGEAIRR
ncbi:MAG TPA: KGG domain-containing protein, partial [Pseudomonadota bacterium]|nr:KGG domain-containing protein [Pseudomonadota bacterium]